MSAIRGFFPAVVAIGVGVVTGYYTFQPTFQQLAAEKRSPLPDQSNLSKNEPVESRGPSKTIPTASSPTVPSGLPPQTIQDPGATNAVTWKSRLWPFGKPSRANVVSSTAAETKPAGGCGRPKPE